MSQASPASVTSLPIEQQRLEDIGFMTCMTLTLLGNYSQTGHFGGPLAYTPFNVATHLAGPEQGGLRVVKNRDGEIETEFLLPVQAFQPCQSARHKMD